MKKTAILIVLGLMAAPAAFGETMTHSMDHSGHMMSNDVATKAYQDANMAMHSAMDIDYTGNPDIDFVTGMIAHHQGAIDMAKVVLEHGADPEIRKLAQDIIAAQEGEIAFMRDWLAKNGQ